MAWTTPSTAVAGSTLSAAFWNEQVRDNLNALYGPVRRIAHIERTTTYTVSATTLAAAADVFSSDLTFTADGTSKYLIEFYCQRFETGTANQFVFVNLVDGSGTGLGSLAGVLNVSSTTYAPAFARVFYQPAAGSFSINVRATKSGGADGAIYGGSGGTGATSAFPMYLSVYGPPLT